MKFFDYLRFPLTTMFLLAPVLVAGCNDDGGNEAAEGTESESGDGDGDPGDGDGDPGDGDGDGEPGDGDGDPGDGDGDPGDGDGDPGDGDGDPGDGDGDPGDGDGDPGDGDGDPGDGDGDPGDECAPFDAMGVGPCEAFFGYSWNGVDCVGLSGCNCEGTDCDNLYETPEQCLNAHAQCGMGNACTAQDAKGDGLCDQFFGYAWDGFQCIGVSGCECTGVDCDNLPWELSECEDAHAQCLPPDDGCAALPEPACLLDDLCMTINGSPLMKTRDSWCSLPSQFLGCDDSAFCLQVFTWGCGPFGEIAEFPTSCLPPGWDACDPPVFNPPPC
jgi:hypothetical protein